MKIMIVDDEFEVRECLKEILEMENHEVIDTGNPTKVAAMLEEDAVDLVITDLRMPQMRGEELVSALKESYRDMPIFVMTGEVDVDKQLKRMGVSRVMYKPISIKELCNSIEEFSCCDVRHAGVR